MRIEFIQTNIGKLSLNLNKIILAFAIFLLCIIWIGLYYKIETEKQIEVNNAIKATANFARAFEEHTLGTIKNADQTALFLKYQYEKEGRAIDIPQYMREGRFSNQPFVLLGVIDENGDFAASNQIPFVSSNLKDREHFFVHQNSDNGALFISKPVLGRSSGKWSIQMTRRINKPDGTFGGAAVVSVDPFYFTEFYKQIDLGNRSSIAIVGLDGIVRTRLTGHEASTGQDLSDTILMKQLLTSDTGHYWATSKIDGIRRICSYRILKDYPLVVVVGAEEETVLLGMHQRVASYYLVAGLVSCVILLFIIVILFITALQRRDRKALKQAHDNMEEKVQLRTQELVVTNQELIEEVIERKRVEVSLRDKTEEIQYIAYTDVLTGLPNRAYLNERLDAEMKATQRGDSSGCIMFIDLDDLKTVNDSFGHMYGDKLITIAGHRITENIGCNAVVTRTGGDEFVVILLGERSRTEIVSVADKIIRGLAMDCDVYGERLSMSASLGIALYPNDGDTAEDILKNADNAMYAAKRNGRNCWHFFESAMQSAMLEKVTLTNNLRYALKRKELFLCYQPQVTINSGAVVGFEALIRWKSHEYGIVSPVRFIPIAEQSGLILSIGEWVLNRACQFARTLADIGHGDIYVAVNISPRQLAVNNFVELVKDAIAKAGIKPQQLELEITENVLLNSMEDAISKFSKLRSIGVRLALDDFGTGFSSLTYLRCLPVGTLKIDKSFIDIISDDKSQAEIIDAIITMAHALKMRVVAEGVENEEQLQYLKDKQCDCIQGYIVGRPVPEEEAIKFLG